MTADRARIFLSLSDDELLILAELGPVPDDIPRVVNARLSDLYENLQVIAELDRASGRGWRPRFAEMRKTA